MTLPSIITNDKFQQIQEMVKVIRDLLESRKEDIVLIFDTMHPADAAILLQFLTHTEREEVVSVLGQSFDPEILSYLDESVRDSILDMWAVHELARKLEQLEGQDAIKILEELHKEERRALLRAVKPEIRVFLEEGLAYPEESAGRLMNHQVVAIPQDWTVGQVRSFLMTASSLPDDLLEIFVVDRMRSPIGKILLNRLFKESANVGIKEILVEIEVVFAATAQQDDIIFAFRKYSLISAPVVDKNNRLIGVISVNEILDLMHIQAQEGFLHSGGLDESDFYANWWQTSKARIRWLSVSMLASAVVAMMIDSFNDLISKRAELAALISIVMSMSGNAGVQVVTVIIRALMNRELGKVNTRRTVVKELMVGITNGVLLGIFFGCVFGLRDMDYRFIILFISSLILSMIWTAIAGTIFPIFLNRVGIDPALSAGVFLSATIDAVAAFAFLSIANMLF